MPKSSSLRVPSYRRHKPTSQAVVTINGRDIYLGKWNTAASKAEYDRLQADMEASGHGGVNRLMLYETRLLDRQRKPAPVQLSAVASIQPFASSAAMTPS